MQSNPFDQRLLISILFEIVASFYLTKVNRSASIIGIIDYWSINRTEMNPNLVHPTRDGFAANQRVQLVTFHHIDYRFTVQDLLDDAVYALGATRVKHGDLKKAQKGLHRHNIHVYFLPPATGR